MQRFLLIVLLRGFLVAYVQVKPLLQTWKIAAFIVAFFSSFFSYSAQVEIDFSKLDGKTPQSTPIMGGRCFSYSQGNHPSDLDPKSCQEWVSGTHGHQRYEGSEDYYSNNEVFSHACTQGFKDGAMHPCGTWVVWTLGTYADGVVVDYALACPPDAFQSHTFAHDPDDDGDPDACYNPNDVQAQLNEKNQLNINDDYCKSLVLDSGNNIATNACYSAPNGAACSVSQVSIGDTTYYEGTANNPLGCGSADVPAYDTTGTGDERDGCLHSDGVNYCEANRDKHCQNISGTEICDDGCIDSGDKVFCDASKHPDVGEGESDYFNSNGTCSVIAASSSKGFCKEMGGTWDETQDYTETVCPVGSGTCSVPTGGHCQACFDAGGTWTPDPNAINSQETNASLEIAALVKKGNTKLAEIENTSRVASEVLTSTVKSGNNKLVAAIDALTKVTKDKPTGGGAAQEEREIYTTTTGAIDKSKINSLFDNASKTSLENDIEQLKQETTNFISTARTEAVSYTHLRAHET